MHSRLLKHAPTHTQGESEREKYLFGGGEGSVRKVSGERFPSPRGRDTDPSRAATLLPLIAHPAPADVVEQTKIITTQSNNTKIFPPHPSHLFQLLIATTCSSLLGFLPPRRVFPLSHDIIISFFHDTVFSHFALSFLMILFFPISPFPHHCAHYCIPLQYFSTGGKLTPHRSNEPDSKVKKTNLN